MAEDTVVGADDNKTNPAGDSQWRARIERSKKQKKELLDEMQTNVDYRRGKPFESDSDEDRVAIPVDWSQTKAKQAQLFSQVPQVMLTPKHPAFAAAVPVFAKELNETLTRAKVGVAMDECLPDVINAAGVAAVIVGYEARMAPKLMPKVDTKLMPPEAIAQVMQTPELVQTVQQPVDVRFYTRRISPAKLLWPTKSEFSGSDFDDAPWMGFSDTMTWAEAKATFNLEDDVKEKVVGTPNAQETSLSPETTQDAEAGVEYDELYYWAYRYDPECKSFCKIRRIVFIKGLTKPVIHEDWKGQQATADGKYVGALKFPVRVLTLTYISDEPIPPSDTAIGRPQVDELIRSRSQMVQQRDSSKPMRWFDVNRVDPQVMDALMQGTWQGMIPTNGDGTRVIGEVARAQYPKEDFDFDRVVKSDLQEAWQIGANQVGAFASGERSASEAQIIQQNFSTRIGYERARVGSFFCGIAEVMAGLLSLFGDFASPRVGEDGAQRLEQWDRKTISNEMVYTIRMDSTVLLDSNQRLQKANNFLNMTAKSGFVDVEPILREIAALSGYDPDQVVKAPTPKGPEPPNISWRFSSEDIVNPVALAILMKAGQAPTPQELEAALKLLQAASQGVMGGAPAPAPVSPAGPEATGEIGPIPMEDTRPEWQMADRINTRRNDGSAQ